MPVTKRKHYSAEDKIRIVPEGLRGRTASPRSVAARQAILDVGRT